MIVLLGIKGNKAHEMQRFRMVGMGGEHLAAAELGVQWLSGSQKPQASLTESRRRARRVVVGDGLRFSGGPAFAAIHACFQKKLSTTLPLDDSSVSMNGLFETDHGACWATRARFREVGT